MSFYHFALGFNRYSNADVINPAPKLQRSFIRCKRKKWILKANHSNIYSNGFLEIFWLCKRHPRQDTASIKIQDDHWEMVLEQNFFHLRTWLYWWKRISVKTLKLMAFRSQKNAFEKKRSENCRNFEQFLSLNAAYIR